MSEHAANRRANFFKGTMRDPEARTVPDAAEAHALSVVKTHIETQVISEGRVLSSAQLDRALAVAQRLIRALPRDQLQSIGSHSGLLKSITDQSLAVAPIADARSAAQARLDERNGAGMPAPLAALMGRRGAEGADRSPSSARFAEMDDARMTKTMQEARGEAMRLGMPWALNNPELLKLGSGAIKTLHDAGVRRETFERMTGDRVGIRAETAVHFAAWSKRQALTPEQTNRLMDSTSNLHESLTRELPADERRRVQRDLDQALSRYVTGPNTPEARRELEEQRMRHARTEQQREQVRANTRELEAVAQQTHAKVVKADTAVVKTEAGVAANQGDLDDPPAKKPDGQPPATGIAAPVKPATAKQPAPK